MRTKRLIERGAILESIIGNATDFTNEQIQHFLIEIFCDNSVRVKVEKLRSELAQRGSPLNFQWRTYTPFCGCVRSPKALTQRANAGDYFRLTYDDNNGNVTFVTSEGREGVINVNALKDHQERIRIGGFALAFAG